MQMDKSSYYLSWHTFGGKLEKGINMEAYGVKDWKEIGVMERKNISRLGRLTFIKTVLIICHSTTCNCSKSEASSEQNNPNTKEIVLY